jgi:hypothetical protein
MGLVLVVFAMAGCSLKPPGTGDPAAVNAGPTPTPGIPTSLSYINNVKPMMDKYCVSCHGVSTMAMGGVLLDSYTLSGLTSQQNFNRWLAAYNSIFPLGDMPESGLVPTADERAVMKAWLDAGAPEFPSSPTPSPSVSPTPTPTPTASPAPTGTPTPTPSVPPTPTPSPSATPTPAPPAPNQAPLTAPLTLWTPINVPVFINLWARDPENSPLVYSISQPAHGKISGSLPNPFYTPNKDFLGTENMIYQVTDPGGLKSSAPVKVIVVEPSHSGG